MLKHKQRVSKACAKEETWVHNIQKYWPYYLMVLPGLLFFVIHLEKAASCRLCMLLNDFFPKRTYFL